MAASAGAIATALAADVSAAADKVHDSPSQDYCGFGRIL
jgi:hypothetical protein